MDNDPHPVANAFITNRYFLVIAIVVILVAGAAAFKGLPRQEDPIISNRFAQILTVLPGASAARVEALVSEPLEKKLKEIPSIKRIESNSRSGTSIVTIELIDAITEDTNDAIFSEVRDKMAAAAAEPYLPLPPAALE